MGTGLQAYRALAHHLAPYDPALGVRQIDRAILRLQRARFAHRNRWRALWLAGQGGIIIGLLALGPQLYRWLISDPPHMIIDGLARSIPLWLGWVMLALSGAVVACCLFAKRDADPATLPEPPAIIADWLAARGRTHELLYWHETYWSLLKRQVNRRVICGFTFWRKVPASLARYEALVARTLEIRCKEGVPDALLAAYVDHFEEVRSLVGAVTPDAPCADICVL